jgi:hypothetical protein
MVGWVIGCSARLTPVVLPQVEAALGCDIICLAPAPLHIVPLFCFRGEESSIPHWVYICFFLSSNEYEAGTSSHSWIPSCVLPFGPPASQTVALRLRQLSVHHTDANAMAVHDDVRLSSC